MESAIENTGEAGSSELYGLAAGLGAAAAFAASGASSADDLDADDREAFRAAQPFDARFRVERNSDRASDTFAGYLGDAVAWRRVDGDWLQVASDLALQLDSATNNTSLALAIERIADGKVLLFPADAQQGNWLSWHDAAMTNKDIKRRILKEMLRKRFGR